MRNDECLPAGALSQCELGRNEECLRVEGRRNGEQLQAGAKAAKGLVQPNKILPNLAYLYAGKTTMLVIKPRTASHSRVSEFQSQLLS